MVCGLSLTERARRVARKAGATEVVLDTVPAGDRPLLVIDATEHVVHTPLIAPLLATGATGIAVNAAGDFAGAVLAVGPQRAELAAAIETGPTAIAALVASWRAAGVATSPHGEIARHPARNRSERRAAVAFLFQLVRKAQDTFLVRNFNRRVSYPFTRLMLPTPITPNMISVAVFFIGAFGCVWLTQPGYWPPVIGTLVILFAGYIDGCDGEIARIRLETSKLGAWLDTIADEATTVVFVTCLGLHVYASHGAAYPWLLWVVIGASVLAVVSVYCIYYYLLATNGSGNSQDYPTSGGILAFLRLLVRREVINLASVLLALAGQVVVLYALIALGGVISAGVLLPQHLALRVRRRRAARAPAATH